MYTVDQDSKSFEIADTWVKCIQLKSNYARLSDLSTK